MKTVSLSAFVCTLVLTFTAWAEAPRFARSEPVAGQPVVVDSSTGLVWQGCAAGLTGSGCASGGATTMNWQAALAYCEGLDWGGHTDWRLPDVNELASLVDDSRSSPAIDPAAFPATPSSYFWSSSSYAASSSDAWGVSFNYGYVYSVGKTSTYYARCVRGGPWD